LKTTLRAVNTETFTALPTAVQWSHVILSPRLRAGDAVVDATAGNGHDTVFLAQHVLPGGLVFAFDVQQEAVEATRRQIENWKSELGDNQSITLHHAGHERMAELLPPELCGHLRAVMFNLGYLPGGEKTLITRVDTTLSALEQALEWLAGDGVLTVVVYPGHEGGRQEADVVERWMVALPSDRFEAQRLGYVNFKPTTPFCLAVRKRA
jgi:16S rRNA C1402 N4-methylase RsmH